MDGYDTNPKWVCTILNVFWGPKCKEHRTARHLMFIPPQSNTWTSYCQILNVWVQILKRNNDQNNGETKQRQSNCAVHNRGGVGGVGG